MPQFNTYVSYWYRQQLIVEIASKGFEAVPWGDPGCTWYDTTQNAPVVTCYAYEEGVATIYVDLTIRSQIDDSDVWTSASLIYRKELSTQDIAQAYCDYNNDTALIFDAVTNGK